MNYLSTRSSQNKFNFAEVTLKGLGPDGGLFVPERFPTMEDLLEQDHLSYCELAEALFEPFVSPCIDRLRLKELVRSAYQNFDIPDVVNLQQYHGEQVLELFHGPTLAFKDIALQFLGKVFGHLLCEQKAITVIGATSGDTGGAAIAALDGIPCCQIFMLYPKGRVSEVQELQMTAGVADNVFPIAIDGSFDDAQALVKQLFGDSEIRARFNLTTVNSINWCRIMAQMAYYFFAARLLHNSDVKTSATTFVVPTGNFGDVIAGYFAHKCGLPVQRLVVACNENDLLARTYHSGVYQPRDSRMTLSPAMDIQVASNFERLLFELSERDCDYVKLKMKQLQVEGKFTLEPFILSKFRALFDVYAISDEDTAAKMRELAQKHLVVDPHTAVALCAAERYRQTHTQEQLNLVTLSTAHPVKFADTIKKAAGTSPQLPPKLIALSKSSKKVFNCSNQYSEIKTLILNRTVL